MSMSIIKSNIKVVLLQIVYSVLLLCLKPIFHTPCIGCERVFYVQTNIEIILEIVLFLGLSFSMCYYILKTKKMLIASLLMGLSLWILFEISKYVEYLMGFLPHYGDVPIIVSLILSLMGILIYMSVLYLLCLFLRRKNIIK